MPIKKLFGGVSPDELLTPGSKEAQALLRRHGGTLTPGQFKIGFLFDTIENMLEASFFGGGIIGRARAGGQAAAISALDESIPKVLQRLDTDQVGILLSEAIQNSHNAQRSFTSAAYGVLDQKIQAAGSPEIVNLSPALDKANDLFKEWVAAKNPEAIEVMNVMRAFGGAEPVSFSQADKIRSVLLDKARDEVRVPAKVRHLAGEVANEVDGAMQLAGFRLGPLGDDVLDALSHARGMARLQAETFNNKLVAGLVQKTSPEQIGRTLMAGNNPTQVKRVREILRDPQYRQAIGNPEEIWNQIRATWMDNLRLKAGQNEYAELSGKALGQQLDKSLAFKELFPDIFERNAIRTSARALEMSQAKAGANKSGSVFIQLTQAGALGTAIMGIGPFSEGIGKEEGAILLGPPALAVLLTRPKFASWLLRRAASREVRTGRGTASAMAQMISRVSAENIPFVYRAPDGSETIHQPQPTGGAKPQSKF